MKTSSFQLSNTHFLVTLGLAANMVADVKVEIPTNHIIAIDCSGSMYSELRNIRTQIKNKLPLLVKPKDTVSIIWFSGRGQFGVLVEGLAVKTPQGLANLQSMVDRYLQPQGLTGFKEPLETVQQVVERVTKSANINTHSLLFLTDGYDNQWSTQQLVEAVKPLGKSLASAVFVEYGYYCNRALLAKLAEEVGGRLIFSKDFQEFEPSFEQHISSKLSGKPKKKIQLPVFPKHNIAFSFNEEGIVVYGIEEDNSVLVDDEVQRIFFHSGAPVGDITVDGEEFGPEALYASLNVLSQRMKSDDVYSTLGTLGDVQFLNMFTNAFGKQKLYDFQGMALEVAQGQRKPYAEGYNENYLPKEDAYSLLHLFSDLMATEGNYFVSEHPEFVYKRIGAKKVAAVSKKEQELQDQLGEVTSQYQELLVEAKKDSSKRKLLSEVSKKMADLTEELEDAAEESDVTFVATPNPLGTPINDLVWNASRPNLSVLVRRKGVVQLPENDKDMEEIESFRYNNYTLIRDGIVNVDKLPVRLNEETFDKIQAETDLLEGQTYNSETVYVLELNKLPIVNRQMVSQVSAVEAFNLQLQLIFAQGRQSVFNYYMKTLYPRTSIGYTEQYGAEFADWLKELGVTDYNGFAPRVTSEKIGESYMSTELNLEVEGFKSKPTVKTVLEKLEKGKSVTERETILLAGYQEYKDFCDSKPYLESTNQPELLKAWLETKQADTVTEVRGILNKLARIKFSVILGQTWFKEFKDLEDNSMTVTFNGKEFSCKALLVDKEVEI